MKRSMRVVYIDQFLLINFILNYILLYVTKRILKYRTSKPRLFIGSVVASLYAVFMFVPNTGLLYTMLGKFLFSLILLALTYSVTNFKSYLRTVAVFYVVCFVFGGCCFAIVNSNALSLKLLISSTVIAYIAISFVVSLYKKLCIRDSSYADITVELDGKAAAFRGLVDTGNSLNDPLTGLPVVIVQFDKIVELFPDEIKNAFYIQQDTSDIMRAFSESGYCSRFRLVPYHSIGKADGLIIAFKPTKFSIDGKETAAVIGIAQNNVSSDASYFALVNPQALL